MKYVKMLGLLAVAAAALMAFAGTASATQLTDASGNVLGVGTVIHAEAESTVTLHPPIGDIECSGSTVKGSITNAGGASATVSGPIDTTEVEGKKTGLTFTGCNATVTVLQTGSLEIHTKTANADGNGTLTSKGTRVTVVFAGFHCIFETNATNGTDIGTLTGSKNVVKEIHNPGKENEVKTFGGTATLDIEATIPRVGGTSGVFCGSTAQWTGSYKVDTPDYLDVD